MEQQIELFGKHFHFLGVYVKFDYVSIGYNTTHAKDTPNAINDVY